MAAFNVRGREGIITIYVGHIWKDSQFGMVRILQTHIVMAERL